MFANGVIHRVGSEIRAIWLSGVMLQDACSLIFCSNHRLIRVSEETPRLRATDWILSERSRSIGWYMISDSMPTSNLVFRVLPQKSLKSCSSQNSPISAYDLALDIEVLLFFISLPFAVGHLARCRTPKLLSLISFEEYANDRPIQKSAQSGRRVSRR